MASITTKVSGDKIDALMDVISPKVLELGKNLAPVARKHGGRLRDNIREEKGTDGRTIVMDIDYAIYTDMKWTYNRRWGKTLVNPHEGWFTEDYINGAISMIQNITGSEVRRVG